MARDEVDPSLIVDGPRKRKLLSHVRNRLSAESTRALLCLGYWDKMGYVANSDLLSAANLPDAKDDEMESFDVI
ncbi:hypothetical protein H0H81_009638 [Sphagnurus paluster]|nr:hypothetical protein H0H81_005455 [Sphagnurus paluster]KAG5639999.1 hypothetical protein H0H81_000166 [Sphagnurus paluster]KAG5644245.1 hypothetical protein H0H81_009638 [Sphagnurus paluster]